MNCRAVPYEGNEPYVFFSYCRKNAEEVYPLIEKMAEAGIRLWYDEGIHIGDDWPEVIASHISRCAACVMAVSVEFAGSHSCRSEMNFAVEKGIIILPVIMSDFPMTPGMKYMLGSTQYIRRYECGEAEFMTRLLSAGPLQRCRGESIPLRPKTVVPAVQPAAEVCAGAVSGGRAQPETEDRTREKTHVRERAHERTEEMFSDDTLYDQDNEKTLYMQDDATAAMGAAGGSGRHTPAVLVDPAQKTYYVMHRQTMLIGRAGDCDVVINKRTISSRHAEIGRDGRGFYVRDEDSLNGTVLHGELLEGLKPVRLEEIEELRFADEEMIFLSGTSAENVMDRGSISVLQCAETNEEKVLGTKDLPMGRSYAWPKGTFTDRYTSRLHATITYRDGYILSVKDEAATNGTYLNGRRLAPGEKCALHDGDDIRFGRIYSLHYREIVLAKG